MDCSTSPKADGLIHEHEGQFLHRIAEIFRIDEAHYEAILSRHVNLGAATLMSFSASSAASRSRKSKSVTASWSPTITPDRLIARGPAAGIH